MAASMEPSTLCGSFLSESHLDEEGVSGIGGSLPMATFSTAPFPRNYGPAVSPANSPAVLLQPRWSGWWAGRVQCPAPPRPPGCGYQNSSWCLAAERIVDELHVYSTGECKARWVLGSFPPSISSLSTPFLLLPHSFPLPFFSLLPLLPSRLPSSPLLPFLPPAARDSPPRPLALHGIYSALLLSPILTPLLSLSPKRGAFQYWKTL